MTDIKVEYDRRWDDRIRFVRWRLNGRVICAANRRVGEEDQYDFFGTKLTPEAPRVCRLNISLEQCSTEVTKHIDYAEKVYGFNPKKEYV
jgi:hypothetical protein